MRSLRRSGPPSQVQPIPRSSRVTAPGDVPLERLRLTVMQRLDGLLAGDHAGLFPGHGTERGEARPYVPGDDPRHIDWAVTARNHEPHVRDMIADHELDVWLILDTSSSLGFGTALATKHEVAWSAAGAFALLASTGGNRVGGVRTTTHGSRQRPKLVPARGGSNHTGALLSVFRRPPRDGERGDLAGAIDTIGRVARRRGMAVVISDFIGDPAWQKPLRGLAQRHDVVAVEVVDPREVEMPDVGLIAVIDPESGRRRLVDTAHPRVRVAYDQLARKRRAEVTSLLKGCGADHLVLRTDRDWVLDFVTFVSSRKVRLTSAGRTQ
jgi:uncharacterized protein (DUF58 family)